MTFGVLHCRLLEHIRLRIRNGELTERSFARRIGVSQPHIHNVLKGIRSLTPELADRILAAMNVSVFELARPVELSRGLELVTSPDFAFPLPEEEPAPRKPAGSAAGAPQQARASLYVSRTSRAVRSQLNLRNRS
jgi:transcriptional regulator with XRE-family HTH domain